MSDTLKRNYWCGTIKCYCHRVPLLLKGVTIAETHRDNSGKAFGMAKVSTQMERIYYDMLIGQVSGIQHITANWEVLKIKAREKNAANKSDSSLHQLTKKICKEFRDYENGAILQSVGAQGFEEL